MIINDSKYRTFLSTYFLKMIILVFQTSWFSWSHQIILVTSLSEVLRYHNSIGVSVPIRDSNKIVSLNDSRHEPIRSSIHWPSHESSLQDARNKRDGEFNKHYIQYSEL
jgi:hypothetical protein